MQHLYKVVQDLLEFFNNRGTTSPHPWWLYSGECSFSQQETDFVFFNRKMRKIAWRYGRPDPRLPAWFSSPEKGTVSTARRNGNNEYYRENLHPPSSYKTCSVSAEFSRRVWDPESSLWLTAEFVVVGYTPAAYAVPPRKRTYLSSRFVKKRWSISFRFRAGSLAWVCLCFCQSERN